MSIIQAIMRMKLEFQSIIHPKIGRWSALGLDNGHEDYTLSHRWMIHVDCKLKLLDKFC